MAQMTVEAALVPGRLAMKEPPARDKTLSLIDMHAADEATRLEALPLPFRTPAAVKPPPLPLARFSLSLARHVAHFDPQPTTGLPQPAHLRPVPVRAAAAAAAARRTPPLLIGRRTLWRVTCPRLTVPPAPLVSFALSSVDPAAAAAAARFSRSSARACNRSALRAASERLSRLSFSRDLIRTARIAPFVTKCINRSKENIRPTARLLRVCLKSSRFATHPKSRWLTSRPSLSSSKATFASSDHLSIFTAAFALLSRSSATF